VSHSLTTIGSTLREQGFVHLPGFFSVATLAPLRAVVQRFHAAWLLEHAALYRAGAINSAYLTARDALDPADRLCLFRFVAQQPVHALVAQWLAEPAFMNTQLFFNPLNAAQANYWHRDMQYTGMSLAQQQAALTRLEVLHLRVALNPEPGLELVPGSHQRWDTEQQLAIRLQQEGLRNNEPLAEAVAVPLQPGDLLIFSANMLHRGLYGLDRLAFDMLYCERDPGLLAYVREDCLPEPDMLCDIDCPQLFAPPPILEKSLP
jgi:hypothetical protein